MTGIKNRLVPIAWGAEKLLGALFVASAILKAVDLEAFGVQISYYHIVKLPALVWTVAIGALAAETLLGVAMLVGLRLRGWTFAIVAAMLLGFTAVITYSWFYYDLEDCGCFGAYLPMGPAASIGKNVAFLVLTAFAWWALHGKTTPEWARPNPSRRMHIAKTVTGIVCAALVVTAGIFRVEPTPPPPADCRFGYQFEANGQSWDLSQGRYLIAIFSADCDHCKAAAEVVNEFAYIPDLPPVVALMMGGKEEIEDFRAETDAEFPLHPIESGIEWAAFLIDAPPRYFLIEDCQEIQSWNTDPPTLDELMQ